jgi:branched-chain amino acid transport system ATP-binding protein
MNEINVSISGFEILTDISFEVNANEIVAIIGPNGAGKSTLLKTIMGIYEPLSGSIEFKGNDITHLPPYKIVELGIALIPEGRRLFPSLSVLQNLKLGAYTRRARKKQKETLEFVFNLFPILEKRKNQLAGTLSGGEQQMLAIARGLMSAPELLLIDECSLGLSPKVTFEVFQVIEKLRNEEITILIVDQNARYVLEIADRGYVLESGRVFLEDEAKSLMENEHVKKSYLGL